MRASQARAELEIAVGITSGDMVRRLYSPALAFHWFNRAAYEIALLTSCLDGKATLAVAAGEPLVRLPDLCADLTALVFDGAALTPSRQPLANQIDTTAGTPKRYYQRKPNGIVLDPIPSADGTLTAAYTRRPVPVSQDSDEIDLPEELSTLVVLYAIWRYYLAYQPEMSPNARQEYREALGIYRRAEMPESGGLRSTPRDDFFGEYDNQPILRVIPV